MPEKWQIAAVVFLFGAIVGSFLNVCIYRLPLNKSIVSPGSRCMECGKPVRWYDNIPIFSWVLLRGRCRSCGVSFSARYPFVELLTALLTVALFLKYGISIQLAVMFVFCATLVIITFIDLDHQIIPNELTGPFILLGYAGSLFMSDIGSRPMLTGLAGGVASLALAFRGLLLPWGHKPDELEPVEDEAFQIQPYLWFLLFSLPGIIFGIYGMFTFKGESWPSSLLGIFAGADLICIVIVLWYAVKREEGMGGGDLKLLAMMGAFLGLQAVPFIIFAASLVGTVAGISIMVIQKKGRQLAIPFGPYLAMGAVMYIFFGPQIIRWYLNWGH